jgi:hypothetical protein
MDQSAELLPAFFCIPDITGFTKLIATADISFSKEIVPNILRKMIDTNALKMSVAEIEGDAVFFYRTGRLPAFNKLLHQCDLLYNAFREYIESVKKTDEENFNKHLAHGELGLKIIVHYGKISTSNIKGRTKLIGQDVIIAHKLLKNNIDEREYILFTEQYLKRVNLAAVEPLLHLRDLKKGMEVYDYIGSVKYRYVSVNPAGF